MAVHMIRLATSIEGDYDLDALNVAMNDWVSEQSEWTADPDSHHITESIPRGESTTAYFSGIYRFHLSDAKNNLIQKCEDKLVNKVAWYRLGYHVCTHDEENPTHCEWDEQREWTAKNVTIPDDVPTFVDTTI